MISNTEIKAEVARLARSGLLVDVQRHHDVYFDEDGNPGYAETPAIKIVVAGTDAAGRCFRTDVDLGRGDTAQTLRAELSDAAARVQACQRGDFRAPGVRVSFERLRDVICYHGTGWRTVARTDLG